jgi:GAF domain-containing protein
MPTCLEKRNLVWDDGISAGVIRSGEPAMIQEEILYPEGVESAVESALCVPVKTETEILGTLSVFRSSSQPFTQKEEDLLEAVADFAAVALLNASLQWSLKQSPPGR